jgi:hypothetical protein
MWVNGQVWGHTREGPYVVGWHTYDWLFVNLEGQPDQIQSYFFVHKKCPNWGSHHKYMIGWVPKVGAHHLTCIFYVASI